MATQRNGQAVATVIADKEPEVLHDRMPFNHDGQTLSRFSTGCNVWYAPARKPNIGRYGGAMSYLTYLARISAICASLLLVACEDEAEIVGTVQDNFGNPIEGVAVRIADSTFAARTDADGRYTVPYAPGTFQIEFEAERHLPDSVQLELASRQAYPLRDIRLTKIPDAKGLFIVGQYDYIRLPSVMVLYTQRKVRYIETAFSYYVLPPGEDADDTPYPDRRDLVDLIQDQQLEVLDTLDANLTPLVLQEKPSHMLGTSTGSFGSFHTSIAPIEEVVESALGVRVRKLQFKKEEFNTDKERFAVYCFVELYTNRVGSTLVKARNADGNREEGRDVPVGYCF